MKQLQNNTDADVTSRASKYVERRSILKTLGTISLVGLAGCIGDSNGTDGTGPADDDSGERTDTDDSQTGDDDSTPADDDSSGNGAADSPRLRDVLTFESSYVMEMEFSAGSSTTTLHEGDSYMTGTFQGQQMEAYHIGNDTYTVVDGQCFSHTIEPPEDSSFDPEDPGDDLEEYVSTGTTTINGEEVYTFDLGDGIYYVSVATGYPVRFEAAEEGIVIDFHSWGATSPISPPDMDCL